MNRSDFRPQLSIALRSSLARRPHRRPFRWTRPDLLGPERNCSYMMQSTTPAERDHLAIAMVHMLPSWAGRNSAIRDLQYFQATFIHPARPLSTLRTPRCHDARKTRSRPVRYDFDRIGLSPIGSFQLAQRTPYSRGKRMALLHFVVTVSDQAATSPRARTSARCW